MKLRIQDLDEIKHLSQKERNLVLKEYKKAYHFLLFYGILAGFVILTLSLGYVANLLKIIDWPFRFLILIAISYPVSMIVKLLEVNVIARIVIRDLIKDIRTKEKSTS